MQCYKRSINKWVIKSLCPTSILSSVHGMMNVLTCPLLFNGLMAALCCSNTFTTTSCPLLQATCSGVQPWLLTASICVIKEMCTICYTHTYTHTRTHAHAHAHTHIPQIPTPVITSQHVLVHQQLLHVMVYKAESKTIQL